MKWFQQRFPEKLTSASVKDKCGSVVQWLALWTLNPEIRVQDSAGPYIAEHLQHIKVELYWLYGIACLALILCRVSKSQHSLLTCVPLWHCATKMKGMLLIFFVLIIHETVCNFSSILFWECGAHLFRVYLHIVGALRAYSYDLARAPEPATFGVTTAATQSWGPFDFICI